MANRQRSGRGLVRGSLRGGARPPPGATPCCIHALGVTPLDLPALVDRGRRPRRRRWRGSGARPRWSLPTMSAARRRVNGISSSWGTTWLTRPHCERLVGVEEVAGEAHLPGPAHADGLGQQHGEAPARHDPDPGVGVAEAGPLGRDEEVAGQGQLEAAGDGDAVDRADQRLGRSAGNGPAADAWRPPAPAPRLRAGASPAPSGRGRRRRPDRRR